MTLEDLILKAVELKLDAVDMTVYYLKSTDPGYLESLRYLAYKNAVASPARPAAPAWCRPTQANAQTSCSRSNSWIDVTDRLGASHLRVFAGKLPHGATIQQATDWVVDGP